MATISPCTGVCELNERQFCIGCRRHIDEIAVWSRITDEHAAALMAALAGRDIERD